MNPTYVRGSHLEELPVRFPPRPPPRSHDPMAFVFDSRRRLTEMQIDFTQGAICLLVAKAIALDHAQKTLQDPSAVSDLTPYLPQRDQKDVIYPLTTEQADGILRIQKEAGRHHDSSFILLPDTVLDPEEKELFVNTAYHKILHPTISARARLTPLQEMKKGYQSLVSLMRFL
ncbi:hypothetical protein CMO92_02660 [Candidatus Woesearchaeota archaeon]|nr:hypothetical protein [Candidatus Woesearchaeota archaeon]